MDVLNAVNQKSISVWPNTSLISLYISKNEYIDLLVSTMRKFGATVIVFGIDNFKNRLEVSYNYKYDWIKTHTS